jgi:1-acyl-sn-glycerol-3-phosphate acyltransferase
MESYSKLVSITHRILKSIFRPVIKSIWIKSVNGLENVPLEGPAIFALNHQSFFDFLAFTVISPRNVHFLAAEKFFDSLFWKPIMILTGQIKVERLSKNKNDLHFVVKKHIEMGNLLAIFPEGTRSHLEFEMLKAYTGIAQYALEHKVSIVPVGIRGSGGILPKHSSRIKFKKQIEIHIGEPITFTEHWGKHQDKKICTYVTERVIKKIELLSGKKYNHYEFNHND